MSDDLVLTLRRGELLELVETAVARALAAREPKPEASVPARVSRMEVGPMIGRTWCRDTAYAVTMMPGFPAPLIEGKGGRRALYPGPAVLRWLQQHVGILPVARSGRASNDGGREGALPCA